MNAERGSEVRARNILRMDAQTLRAGRERIPLTDIGPVSVQAASQTGPATTFRQYAESLHTIDAPLPGLRAADRGNLRLAGRG